MVPGFASVYTLLFLSPRLYWRFGPGFHSSLVPPCYVLILLIFFFFFYPPDFDQPAVGLVLLCWVLRAWRVIS